MSHVRVCSTVAGNAVASSCSYTSEPPGSTAIPGRAVLLAHLVLPAITFLVLILQKGALVVRQAMPPVVSRMEQVLQGTVWPVRWEAIASLAQSHTISARLASTAVLAGARVMAVPVASHVLLALSAALAKAAVAVLVLLACMSLKPGLVKSVLLDLSAPLLAAPFAARVRLALSAAVVRPSPRHVQRARTAAPATVCARCVPVEHTAARAKAAAL